MIANVKEINNIIIIIIRRRIIIMIIIISYWLFDPFHVTCHFPYLLKIRKRFSDVLMVYRKRSVT